MTDVTSISSPPSYSKAALVAGVFIAAAMLLLMGVQPILVGLYGDHLHLSLRESGWVIAAEQSGAVAGALVGYWLATRARWSHTIVSGSAVALVVNLATAFAGDGVELLLLRFGSGAATTMAYTVAIYFLGSTAAPDRAFGAVMVLQTSLMSVGAFVLSRVAATAGYSVAIASAAVWFVAPIVAALWMPKDNPVVRTGVPAANRIHGNRTLASAGLAGSFLLQLSVFAVWGHLERVGRHDGLSDTLTGDAIGIGVLGGILGGLLPAVIGARFGRIAMIALATALLVGGYVALLRELGWTYYVVGITTMNVGWVLGLIYYMGLTAQHDPDGTFTRLLPFVQVFGAGVGPVCSAIAADDDRLGPIFLVAIVAAISGLVIVLVAATRARRYR